MSKINLLKEIEDCILRSYPTEECPLNLIAAARIYVYNRPPKPKVETLTLVDEAEFKNYNGPGCDDYIDYFGMFHCDLSNINYVGGWEDAPDGYVWLKDGTWLELRDGQDGAFWSRVVKPKMPTLQLP